MERRTSAASGSAFLDELTFSATWRLIRLRELKKVTVLDAIRPSQRLLRWLLSRRGIEVAEAEFFAGHLRTAEGESIRRASRRDSGQIALAAAREIVRKDTRLGSLNRHYGRNTICLFVAKQLHLHVEYWIFRSRAAQALSVHERPVVWLKKPARFDEKLLVEKLPGIDHVFYATMGIAWLGLCTEWLLDVARDVKLTGGCARGTPDIQSQATGKHGVLALQEDQIRFEPDLRGQPHWLDRNASAEPFNTYILKILGPHFSTPEAESRLSRIGVTVVHPFGFCAAIRTTRHNGVLERVRSDRRKVCLTVFGARSYAAKYFRVKVTFFLRHAELMGALALSLNIRVFLNCEAYYSFADAMLLVAPQLGIRTISYQYSNVGFMSTIMMSTSDKFLAFSGMFKAPFASGDISPKEFLPIGYPYDGIAPLVREKACRHRERLDNAGARFVVCYFDESVQHDRWGLVSKEDHLGELHTLARAILADPAFGVVIKSQFVFNTPSKLYTEDGLIQKAVATGRFLELAEGFHRNDIFPTEAALASDLCIGHKYGATAALEAAVAGVRSVMLDSCGAISLWDEIYAQADIEYDTMDSLMEEIGRFRRGEAGHQALGDWSAILHHFDPYRDGRAVLRLRKVIEDAVLSPGSAGGIDCTSAGVATR